MSDTPETDRIENNLGNAATNRTMNTPTPKVKNYDAGLLSDFGGGDVKWWQDYIRAEINRANDYWGDELTAANEYSDRLAAGLPDGMLPKDVEVLREANLGLAVEITTVTEQLDIIEGMYQKVIAAVLDCNPIPAWEREDDQLESPWEVITRIREQRDRLAEALQNIKNELGVPQPEYPSPVANAYWIADEALQSLTKP